MKRYQEITPSIIQQAFFSEFQMADIEKIKSLVQEAEIYRAQGLLEESKETYNNVLKFIEKDDKFSRNTELRDAINTKIKVVENCISELNQGSERPELSKEIQDLIIKLFSFSENEDIATIEGAVALAKFGQYEKALEELQRLINNGIQNHIDKEIIHASEHFNSIIKKLSDSYRNIKEQSIHLLQYAKELSQTYKKSRDDEELRSRLNRYAARSIVDKLVDSKVGVFFQNDRKEATILFAEIKSFTAISEKMNADDLISTLHELYAAAQDICFKNNGIFGNIFGNQFMAVFGLISSDNGAPHDAIKAALEIQSATKKLIANKSDKDVETIEIGIGINTGDIVSGNIGFKNRLEYTVLGGCVDIASKLQQISKGGEIIIGEKTFLYSQRHFKAKRLGKMKSENHADQVICYKIIN